MPSLTDRARILAYPHRAPAPQPMRPVDETLRPGAPRSAASGRAPAQPRSRLQALAAAVAGGRLAALFPAGQPQPQA